MSQTASELVQVLHLEVLYITNVTEDITFLVAVTECVSHQEHGVDRHLRVTVGQFLGYPFTFVFLFVAKIFAIRFEEGIP